MDDDFGAFPAGTTVPLPQDFRCPLCDQTCKTRGFTRHLKTCCEKAGMTLGEYERRFSMDLYSPVHQFAAKWFSLAKFSLTEFGLMDYAGCYWCHIDAVHPEPWYFTNYGRKPETLPLLLFKDGQAQLRRSFCQFRKHLQGDLTLGIWPEMDNSFTVIDLDEHTAQLREDLMERLIDLRLHFYVEFSGQKGYHFWIFWNHILPHAELIRLHDMLSDGIPTDHKLWPFQRSLIKLPLGLHRQTNRLACFVDYQGKPIPLEEQFTYCLNMRTNPVPVVLDCWEDGPEGIACLPSVKRRKSRSTSSQQRWTASQYELCLKDGSKFPDGRHRTLFMLTLYLKDQRRISQVEATSILMDWSQRVPSRQSLSKRLQDVHDTVTRVYERQTCGFLLSRAELTEEEKQIIESVCVSSIIPVNGFVGSPLRKEDITKRVRTATKVALVMASIAKVNGGWIEIGLDRLMREAVVSKQALRRALDLLVLDTWPVDQIDPEEYDEVLWNLDQRPCRHGGLFVCVSRGSFPQFDRSRYRMSSTLVGRLGWPDG